MGDARMGSRRTGDKEWARLGRVMQKRARVGRVMGKRARIGPQTPIRPII